MMLSVLLTLLVALITTFLKVHDFKKKGDMYHYKSLS